ncbi:MAG: phenylalanine--tRNA ligase subunit beta [Ruminococcaceae bacterium]|nr:phenylalanine--tRNA ligase subunit beta [Oscillospiraceae bacterium]
MKAPLSWLRDYVDIDIPVEELQEKLFSSGFEVEELIYLGEEITKCVVGQITHIEKHQDSDHLQICRLDCGEAYGRDIQIVTGADNVFVGARVPVALDGSTLHGGIKIKKGKLRGVESCGMLCSGEELGITDDWYEGAGVYGILILEDTAPIGEDIRKIVGLDEYVFDISITANRPDCQSILGLAREIAAILKKPVKMPDFSFTAHKEANDDAISVRVQAPDLCPRYIAHYVRDVKIEKAPLWMRKRLALVGINAINNVVDITNFILMELGQPMHAFDLSNLGGKTIDVRRAHNGEKIITLDEKEFTLNENHLVICDAEKPVGLAGIMGGLNSEIKDSTQDVVFEAAKFARDSIRKTSRALGQSSDSSAKFCKGVDEYTTQCAMKRALHLMEELNCGTVSETGVEIAAKEIVPTRITTTFAKINKVLGITVPDDTIVEILRSLDFSVDVQGETLSVTAPAWREDVFSYEDLAEEVIRLYGYSHITPQLLPFAAVTNGGLTDAQKLELKAKNALVKQGAFETVTFSFYSAKELDMLRLPADSPLRRAIRIDNPISENYSIMCTTLVPNIVNIMVKNFKAGNDAGRFFELANVYIADEFPLTKLPAEKKTIAIGAFGDNEDFFKVKGITEGLADEFGLTFSYRKAEKPFLHPGMTAEILCGDTVIGYLGRLAYEVCEEISLAKPAFVAEISYELLKSCFSPSMKYAPLPKFPDVVRDFAFVCDEGVTCGEIEAVIRNTCKNVISIGLFDIFRGKQLGEGKKSMAYTVTFRAKDKPLDDEAVNRLTDKILKNLEKELGAVLR